MDTQTNPNPQASAGGEFSRPRHWVSLDELTPEYWASSADQEARGQEFLHKPIETLAAMEKTSSFPLQRRDFLTLMGASMAMTGFACARRPVEKIIPYVVKPEELTPGVANLYASTDPGVYGGFGVLVKTREGRPIKLEGNPDHPVNGTALSARVQASILDLYDPDRLAAPVTVASGRPSPISWAEADAAIAERLKKAARVRVLTPGVSSPSTRKLIQEFLASFEDGKHVQWEPNHSSDRVAAQEECYGDGGLTAYRLDQADLVVSFGSDFLGADAHAEAHARQWFRKRDLRGQKHSDARMSRLVSFESTLTLTGSNSDERHAVNAGDEVKVALAVAHEIIVASQHSALAGDAPTREALRDFSAAKVAVDVGIAEEAIKKVARELWEARGRGLVVGGDMHAGSADAFKLHLAVNLLNSALENDGATVDYAAFAPNAGLASGWRDYSALIAEMQAGRVDVLLVQGLNPAYLYGRATGFVDALSKVNTVVHVSDRVDETGIHAHFVLPEHHFLENWGDHEPRAGVLSLQQPTVHPLNATRSFQDILLGLIRAGKLSASGLALRMAGSEGGWHAYLRENWKSSVYPSHGRGLPFEEFWVDVLQKGVLVTGGGSRELPPRRFKTYALRSLLKGRAAKMDEIRLALYLKSTLGDGSQANNGWLQEMPDPVSTVTWDNHLNVGPSLAAQLKLKQNDMVRVSVGEASVEVPVLVQPGMPASTVSLAVGYGRKHAGAIGNGVGADAFSLVTLDSERRPVFAGNPVKVEKLGWKYELALTQGHHRALGRPIVNDVTLDEYRRDPAAEMHTNPHLRPKSVPTLWPVHEYKGYRWGMAVDQTACTGCGACVIACQAENNIPIVGRDRVRMSREMHWIRIDRYYSGSEENPDVIFQPMMCQHCENAPCETVCPVLATTHNDEGLNDMTYNRCVGTRYCQNNCPYKVRRFNFFDHWKDYRGNQNLLWNPEVTVRTRGVMEKCTFCVHRIQETKNLTKTEGRKLRDGELKTACQQTCPTDAIAFGDINDPNSRVSRLRADARAFRSLEELNAKPAISYLTKVRNKEKGATSHGEHH
ncbi:MAG: 4Fe-4S dicluster domain-containing protein [Bdellovibrionales bacterium]|nr:4Fe-4S dicluster domain-containing protein [Bdellovibrionales bacterium]